MNLGSREKNESFTYARQQKKKEKKRTRPYQLNKNSAMKIEELRIKNYPHDSSDITKRSSRVPRR